MAQISVTGVADGYIVLQADNLKFALKSFINGTAVIIPWLNTDIVELATLVVKAFDNKSNIKQVEFEFNGVRFAINQGNANVNTIKKHYYDKLYGYDIFENDIVFKDGAREYWNQFVLTNYGNGYGRGTVIYAQRWAKYMQEGIAQGDTVEQIAMYTAQLADKNLNISGSMQYFAVSILVEVWKYGEDLKNWYNNRI